MLYEMYAIYDSQSQSYNNPFYFLNDNIARRSAADFLADDNEISRHPADYTMFKLGQYDPQSGAITVYDTKIRLFGFHEIQPRPQTVVPGKGLPGQMDIEDQLNNQEAQAI